eukprot:gene25111-31526_t
MADFVEETEEVEEQVNSKLSGDEEVPSSAVELIDFNQPQSVLYCPTCTMPPEFCEFGATFDKCAPWILENCQEALSEKVLADLLGKASLDDPEGEGEKKKEKKKGGGAAALKKATVYNTRVVIAKIQRQKRKYVTVVSGLETVPDLKIKDAAKIFGKKFSSGASISDSAQTNEKEVTIQGDLTFDLPPLLISEFKVPPNCIFFLEDKGQLRAYA